MATAVKQLLHDKRLAGRSLPYQSHLNVLLHASPNSPIDLHAPEMALLICLQGFAVPGSLQWRPVMAF
jgi:hypothetical protein